jgi:hypothetical protein
MDFEDLKRLYNKYRREDQGFDFVRQIFVDIRRQYLKEARTQGKDANQSWNAWSGKNLQRLIEYAITDFIANGDFPVGVTFA